MKTGIICLVLIQFLLVCSCDRNALNEYIVNRTDYSYTGDLNDSSKVLQEHSFFNRDSIKIKYINEKDSYFYLTEHQRKEGILTRTFFDLDSNYQYSSISKLDKLFRENKTQFYDSSGKVTYTMNFTYRGESKELLKQENIFQDGSSQCMVYEYDLYGNLVMKSRFTKEDSLLLEEHRYSYDYKDRIVTDTAYYIEGRKILNYEYRDDLLFFITEEFEVFSDTDTSYIPLGNSYWKKYYTYDNSRNILEIRTIRMQRNSESFGLDSRILMEYKDGLVVQKKLVNSKDQIIYKLEMEYIY
jgi:hypothetical protein